MAKTVEKAFDILEYISRRPGGPHALGEIASALGMNAATCATILKTLVTRDYVEQPRRKGPYRLGPMAYYLSRHGSYRQDLAALVEEPVRELGEAIHEAAMVATLGRGQRFTVFQVEGSHAVQVSRQVTGTNDVYRTATGRLLLARASDDEIDRFIAENGVPSAEVWPGADTPDKLRLALARTRREEWVVHSPTPEVVALALPLREGDVEVAALGVFLPASRFVGEHREKILAAMERTSDEITRRLTERAQVGRGQR